MSYEIEQLREQDEAHLLACFETFQALRPHLTPETFLTGVREQWNQGYRIAAIRVDGRVAAVAGYRICHFLAFGKTLYLDDLVTHPDFLRRGLAGALLDHVKEVAREEGCRDVHLDTGFARYDAHRLYLNHGFRVDLHHMVYRNPAD